MASTYLTRTPSSAGNRKTWTMSLWFKKYSTGVRKDFAGNSNVNDGQNGMYFHWDSDDSLSVVDYGTGSSNWSVVPTRKYRDTNGFYNVVIAVDTTQATASNRVKIYVNGEQETSFATSNYPSQNYDTSWNIAKEFAIGSYNSSGGNAFDGSMAHVHFIDGTAYDADTFGETDATTGIWKPKTAPGVTYGTNGFFLKFENSGAFGTDSSGNANTFTVNGTMTQNIDTPSNVFATWNSILQGGNMTFANGNTTATLGGTSRGFASTLAGSSGKYYYELKFQSGSFFQAGIVKTSYLWNNDDVWSGKTGAVVYKENGQVYKDASSVSSAFATLSSGDYIMVAVDLDNNKLYFGKNGTWGNSGDPTSGSTGTGAISIDSDEYCFACSGANNTIQTNFGNGYFGTTAVSSAQNPDDGIGIFEYDVPTGYYALNTKSINAQEYS